MATRYHISDDGMPGRCTAATPESCPKTSAGDDFHGTLEEAGQESARRFEEKLGSFVTTSKKRDEERKGEAKSKKEQVEAVLNDRSALDKELGKEEDRLRTLANRSKAKKVQKDYEDFMVNSGFRKRMDEINQRTRDLGYGSIMELRASKAYSDRSLGNGNLPLPPRLKRDQVLAYTINGTPGWLVASDNSGKERQNFIYEERGEWVSSMVFSDMDPLGRSARMEIRPDGLKTFFMDRNPRDYSTPQGPLAGKYSLDPEQG